MLLMNIPTATDTPERCPTLVNSEQRRSVVTSWQIQEKTVIKNIVNICQQADTTCRTFTTPRTRIFHKLNSKCRVRITVISKACCCKRICTCFILINFCSCTKKQQMLLTKPFVIIYCQLTCIIQVFTRTQWQFSTLFKGNLFISHLIDIFIYRRLFYQKVRRKRWTISFPLCISFLNSERSNQTPAVSCNPVYIQVIRKSLIIT